MVRTQIQLPDDVYRAAKRIAAQREMTLAEVVRRGLEHMMRIHPPTPLASGDWTPPPPLSLGAFRTSFEEWRDIANEPPVRRRRRR